MKSRVKSTIELLKAYEALDGDSSRAKQRYRLLSEVHEQLDRLLRLEVLAVGLGEREPKEPTGGSGDAFKRQVREPKSERSFVNFTDLLIELRKFRSLENHIQRQSLAYEIAEALVKLAAEIDDRLKAKGWQCKEPSWPVYLVGLYRRLANKSVQDCFEPPVDCVVNGEKFFETFDVFASRVMKMLEAAREEERQNVDQATKPLVEELSQLTPPLVWGEVVYHCIRHLVDEKDKARLKALDPLFPSERYCLKCHEPFRVSKYNPAYFTCPRCSARERARRYRERKKNTV